MATVEKLGDFSPELFRFPHLQERCQELETKSFLSLSEKRRESKIHQLLLRLIEETATPCFLLAAVNEFISYVLKQKWLSTYTLSQFELWLNQFSGLSHQENYLVRAKIAGRYIPRESYQSLFPIGMGKTYPGSHYVTAHNSPDLDTTIASFWGWMDAFAARVGEGLHVWNVPGGPSKSQVEIQFLFYDLLGPSFFEHFAKTRNALALSSIDLISQEGMIRKTLQDSAQTFDYEKGQSAFVLVDQEGYYLGDWRQLDVEGVRKVTTLLNNSMRWFASYFQRQLTSLFSKEILHKTQVSSFIEEIFSLKLKQAEPSDEFTEKQKRYIEGYLSKVLKAPQGWNSTYGEFWQAMQTLGLSDFALFHQTLTSLPSTDLFQEGGLLIESRPRIFYHIDQLVSSLERAVQSLRSYADQLQIALAIRKEVFAYPPQIVSHRAEVEEIRSKIGPLSYLTVTQTDSNGQTLALGVIQAVDLAKPILGTVSLRDFCNRDETKIPSYFEVISVIDHHKSALSTFSPPSALISDAQSSNALVAEVAFTINDEYSLSGFQPGDIEAQFHQDLTNKSSYQILQRLLQKQRVASKQDGYFVDWTREYVEYLHYLYAILDDTDLLSKVSCKDVLCVASLINRLKSLMLKKEVETISFDDIPRDEKFTQQAAKKLLQNEDMYSLYKKVYDHKELSVTENLRLCIEGSPSSIFSDTKIQNGCNRVGQTKLFAKNFPYYLEHAQEVRTIWLLEAMHFYQDRQECDLHMQLISTVPGAEDVYKNEEKVSKHQDELWLWIPQQEQAIEHLKSFLNAFRFSPAASQHPMDVEFLGDKDQTLSQIFTESFFQISQKTSTIKTPAPVAILRYKAGLLNSRKAMISPYLPKLVH